MKEKEEVGEGPSLAKPAGCETRSTNWLSAVSYCSLPRSSEPSSGVSSQEKGRGCKEAAKEGTGDGKEGRGDGD